MFILYFALWVVLNGKWTTEIGLFGLAFATVIYAFTWKYMGLSPKVDLALVRRVPSAIGYGVMLLAEIIKANMVVCKMILKPDFEPKPQLVQFDVDLVKNRHLVTLANSITLTPGTITVDLHDNHFMVHALDESLVDGLDDGGFVQSLMRMEKQHGAAPAAPAAEPQAAAEEEAQTANETPNETETEAAEMADGGEAAAQAQQTAEGEEDAQ